MYFVWCGCIIFECIGVFSGNFHCVVFCASLICFFVSRQRVGIGLRQRQIATLVPGVTFCLLLHSCKTLLVPPPIRVLTLMLQRNSKSHRIRWEVMSYPRSTPRAVWLKTLWTKAMLSSGKPISTLLVVAQPHLGHNFELNRLHLFSLFFHFLHFG